MQVAGTSGGFFIIYFFPIYIHFKLLRIKKVKSHGLSENLKESDSEVTIPPFLDNDKPISYYGQYFFYGATMGFGIFVLVINGLSIFGIEIWNPNIYIEF